MKKMLALVALATAVAVSGVANAATVDIFVTRNAANTFDLTITTAAGAPSVSGLALATDNATAFTPGATVSVPDSVLDVAGNGFLLISGASAANPLALPGVTNLLLGTFTGSLVNGSVHADLANLGDPVVGTDGSGIQDYAIHFVPEPTAFLLLGMGLAGLGLVRRQAA